MYIEVIYTEYFSENLVFSVYYKSPRGPFIFYSSKITFSWNVFFLFCFYRICIEISRNIKLRGISVLLSVFHSSTPFTSVLLPKYSLSNADSDVSTKSSCGEPSLLLGYIHCIEGPCWLCWPLLLLLWGSVDHEQLLLCSVLPRLDLFPLHLLEKPFFALPSSTETILTCLKFGLDIPFPVDPVLKTSCRPGLRLLSLCRVFPGLYVCITVTCH